MATASSSKPPTFAKLFRYTSTIDLILLTVAACTAIGAGAAMPLMTAVFGNLSKDVAGFLADTHSQTLPATWELHVLYLVYLALGEFVLVYISTVSFVYVAEDVCSKLRQSFLDAILQQSASFHSQLTPGEVASYITRDVNLIQGAIAEKLGVALTSVATFIAAVIVGAIKFWKLTLACMSTAIAIVLVMAISTYYMIRFKGRGLIASTAASSCAEEAFHSIRTVTAHGAQERVAQTYESSLVLARLQGVRYQAVFGFMMGSILCIVFLNYALAFWLGGRFVQTNETDLSAVLTVLMAATLGIFAICNAGPCLQHFSQGVAASTRVFAVIDSSGELKRGSLVEQNTEKMGDLTSASLEFQQVSHAYPSRPQSMVLKNISLSFRSGTTTALVGESGSGKSSIISLIERFYDPIQGQILLNGHDISLMNVHHLRQQIALVEQEPVLFDQSIGDNIGNGLIGSLFEEESKEQKYERVILAAEKANIHPFIMSLPQGYNTRVGYRGDLLSGGQKQRVAIARALVREPKILLLDEPTSALDAESESVILNTLASIARHTTTILVAHRLSTVRIADHIIVLKNGEVVEQGDRCSLLEANRWYAALEHAQETRQSYGTLYRRQIKRKPISFSADQRLSHEKSTGDSQLIHTPGLAQTTAQPSHIKSSMKEIQTMKSPKSSLWQHVLFISRLNVDEWKNLTVGVFASVLSGAAQPVQGVFFAHAIVALAQLSTDPKASRHEVNFWAAMSVMIAVIQLLVHPIQGWTLARCSEQLIYRTRSLAFRCMLQQKIQYFDQEKNSSGALTSILETDALHLSTLSGQTMSILASCFATLIIACTIALAIGWKLALVCMCSLPAILGTGYFRIRALGKFAASAQTAYQDSASYACERLNAIRTVTAFTLQGLVLHEYSEQLRTQQKRSLIPNLTTSLYYAASQSAILLATALGFWYGGKLVQQHEYSLLQFFLVLVEIIFSTRSAGTALSFTGDIAKAELAASRLEELVTQTSKLALNDRHTYKQNIQCQLLGRIEYRNVHFEYPSRPHVPIMKGFDLVVEAGQTVALVGLSGCGKSTALALLERFYTPSSGTISVDNQDIQSFDLKTYRSQIAFVDQLPFLLAGSIKENLLLGLPNRAQRGFFDIERALVRACQTAQIFNFIVSLPKGFETEVGPRSSLLSGGEKQRLAIARALLCEPKILLFDEATSALDNLSERKVQKAIQEAGRGRTTIIVAQRFSTIYSADRICMIDQGQIVEQGTHEELMAKPDGAYRKLVMLTN